MINTITLPREVVEQAVDALNVLNYEGWILADHEAKLEAAIAALREALAAPQPEPVAWALRLGITQRVMVDFTENSLQADNWRDKQCDVIPLYTHPPQRQPLTDMEIARLCVWSLTEAERIDSTPAYALARAIEKAHGIGGDK